MASILNNSIRSSRPFFNGGYVRCIHMLKRDSSEMKIDQNCSSIPGVVSCSNWVKKFNMSAYSNATYSTDSNADRCDNQQSATKKDKTQIRDTDVELDDDFRSYLDEIKREFGDNTELNSERTNVTFESGREAENNISQPLESVDDNGRNYSIKSSVNSESVEEFILDEEEEEASPRSIQDKYYTYADEDAEVILDETEMSEYIDRGEASPYFPEDRETVDEFRGLNLKRGKTGVFELDELVHVLTDEKVEEICVIKVPKILHYTDYLVIGSAKSHRHLNAVSTFVRKLHKRKKNSLDPYVKIEGEKSTWKAVDLGNIVVHLFMPETRRLYDIETLWTVGEEFDDLSHQPQDPVLEAIEKHTIYLDDLKPLHDTS